MARPRLNPPCRGWEYDLPAPDEIPEELEALGHPPNHVNKVYLELPRSTLPLRGSNFWSGMVGMAAAVALLIVDIIMFVAEPALSISIILVMPLGAAICVWAGGLLLRNDIAPPKDEPIRFNRLRRKVYVYQYHQSWLNPFDSKRFYVKPEVYNWDDLRAEYFSIYIPGTAYSTGVQVAVIKPGTNEVVHRFFFGHGMAADNYWNMAVAFMQSGPSALPTYNEPPRDWNNEDPGLNLARRFAPRVKWPEWMDIESRTAPGAEYRA